MELKTNKYKFKVLYQFINNASIVKKAKTTLAIPFVVKNARFTLDKSSILTIVC